jgi:hypothetical protein
MNYLDNIENVRDFYSKFCEYIESHPEKDKFIKHIEYMCEPEPSYNSSRIVKKIYSRTNYTILKNIFRSFIKSYLHDMPHLIVYEEEFNYHTYRYDIFKEEYDNFNSNNSYLK